MFHNLHASRLDRKNYQIKNESTIFFTQSIIDREREDKYYIIKFAYASE